LFKELNHVKKESFVIVITTYRIDLRLVFFIFEEMNIWERRELILEWLSEILLRDSKNEKMVNC
jgi:hypothetical protein